MKIRSSRPERQAFTRIELTAVVLAVGLIAGVLVLSGCQDASKVLRESCENNLKQVGLAFKVWAGDCGDRYPTQVPVAQGGSKEFAESGEVWFHFLVMSNELNTPKVLVCPADKQKTAATRFESGLSDANVSYFVGLDAHDVFPQMFLSGDRNLAAGGRPLGKGLHVLTTETALNWTTAIHDSCGNVGTADAGVSLLDSGQLAEANRNQYSAPPHNLNRLVIP